VQRATATPSHQLPPDLVGPIDAQVGVEHALHFGQQPGVTSRTRRQQHRRAHARGMAPVRRRGNLQRAADLLDPVSTPVLVDEGVHFL
jgi:hypothetical protein